MYAYAFMRVFGNDGGGKGSFEMVESESRGMSFMIVPFGLRLLNDGFLVSFLLLLLLLFLRRHHVCLHDADLVAWSGYQHGLI